MEWFNFFWTHIIIYCSNDESLRVPSIMLGHCGPFVLCTFLFFASSGETILSGYISGPVPHRIAPGLAVPFLRLLLFILLLIICVWEKLHLSFGIHEIRMCLLLWCARWGGCCVCVFCKRNCVLWWGRIRSLKEGQGIPKEQVRVKERARDFI